MYLNLFLFCYIPISCGDGEENSTLISHLDIHIDRLHELDKYLALTREEQVEEYGSNKTHNAMVWDNYYLCLNKQYEAIGLKRVLVPESISIMEGENAHMDCRVCLFPGEDARDALWYWYNHRVPMDEWTVLDKEGRLSIYGLRKEEAGLYECRIGSTKSRPYFLHVVPDSEPVLEVKPPTALAGPYSLPPQTVLGNVLIFSHWNSWSDCSTCDRVGRRYRFGACNVAYSTFFTGENNSYPTPIEEMLELFAEGLPCWSPLLPSHIRENSEVKSRGNEMMIGFCKVPCADEIFEVRNLLGKIIERVNNTAGLFSRLQGPPPLPPMPTRLTIYGTIGQALTLSCPGHGLSDLPYRWAVGFKARIAPFLAKRKSLGRVTVNAKQQLVFTSLQTDDERIYSCWQGRSLAGVVRLLVVDDNRFKISHHLILLGAVLIQGTFLYVCLRIYLNRKRAASVFYNRPPAKATMS